MPPGAMHVACHRLTDPNGSLAIGRATADRPAALGAERRSDAP
jgi:hypothetical protein